MMATMRNFWYENYTMLFDFYEMTMGNGYLLCGKKDQICYFDMFFRSVPDGGGFAIAAGLEQVIDYIENLHFSDADINFLRSKKCFSEEFLSYLRTFKFTGDIWAVPEGTPIFPGEPIITVRAPACGDQVQPYRALRTGQTRIRIRFPPCTGYFGCYSRRTRILYCGMLLHRLHHFGRTVRRSLRRHHGAFLGADVRYRI